ncbi:MAG: J domain-containing protein [Eubacteriales bacterium]|nr:J domain-containing protein [Eubacteriales bacterium]
MKLEEAYRSLGAGRRDSHLIIKKKYHQLMRKYHPDSNIDENPEHLRMAQLLNEAYETILTQGSEAEHIIWKEPYTARRNPQAFCERNVYLWYGLYEEYGISPEETARGKYYWDPEQEEFSMLLRSVNEACGILMQEIEREYEIYHPADMKDPELHIRKRQQLFHIIMKEFVHPYECLEKLVEISETKNGRDHYRVMARLRIQGDHLIEEMKAQLTKDSRLNAQVRDHKIHILENHGRVLGHLSFEEDYFYYIVLPILEGEEAEYEVKAVKMKIHRSSKPHWADLIVKITMRIPSEYLPDYEESHEKEIQELLEEYRKSLRV